MQKVKKHAFSRGFSDVEVFLILIGLCTCTEVLILA